jgi:hypothetical protein
MIIRQGSSIFQLPWEDDPIEKDYEFDKLKKAKERTSKPPAQPDN